MGASLPKAVEAVIIERKQTESFEVVVAEMNGWRNNMEDAHVIVPKKNWGFFGVFDGHGGGQCSEFVARRLKEEIQDKYGEVPPDDAAMRQLVFSIDKEFLETDMASGSTATMCIVSKPTEVGAKHLLHVINAGDSRALLGRIDGSIVDGGGTDKGLTKDHKPDDSVERERIYRCGGTVECSEGNVPRVNGDLAVSRGFGDREYKKTGGPGPEDRPVTCDPEMGHFKCDESDFLLLVCDGVSEGDFSNSEVVQLVAQQLRDGADAGMAAKAVLQKALEKDSKDNVTCMIVLFRPSSNLLKTGIEFIPGPVTSLGHKGFQSAYEAMAQRANLTLAQAVEKRYEALRELTTKSMSPAQVEEMNFIGKPPEEDRLKWFEAWIQALPEEKGSGPGGMDMEALLNAKGGGKGAGKGLQKGGSQPQESLDEGEKEEGGYTWSQKGEEVQITFKLSKIASKKDIKVTFKTAMLTVVASGESLINDTLAGKVEVEDCTWCLAGGGSELQVMLTKKDAKESWAKLLK